MVSPNPTCLVNGSSTMGGANVTASSTVTIALQSTSGVTAWSILCTSTNDLVNQPVSGINATLVVNQVAKTATFTAPSGTFAGLQFTSLVNNGVDVNGTSQPSYSTTFGVWVLTPTNRRVLFVGEKTEGDPVNGWVADINALIENDTSGPGSAGLGLFYNTGSFNVGLDTNGNITTPGNYIQLSNVLSWASGAVSLTATASSLSLTAGSGLLNLTGSAGINIASSLSAATLQWLSTVASPTFTQAATNVSNATGQTMLIQAQASNTGAGATGGQLRLASGGAAGGGTPGNIDFFTGSTIQAVISPTLITFNLPLSLGGNATWISTVSSPTLSQATTAVNSATGASLIVQAQNASGTTSTGGALNLTSGTGTSAAGAVNIQAGGTTVVSVASTTVSLNQPTVQFGNAVVSPIIKQNNNTTNSATGQTLTINAQNATGTTSTGGTLALASGTGTTASGNVTISVGGSLAATYTPSGLQWTNNSVAFVPGANNPTISQQTQTSNVATNILNITAQAPFASATGTNQNAGFIYLNIPAPVGAGNHGSVIVTDSGSTVVTLAGDVSGNGKMTVAGAGIITGSSSLAFTTSGSVSITPNSTLAMTISSTAVTYNIAALQYSSVVASPTINQVSTATNSATGQTLVIQAQNATGTTTQGGALLLASGTGTSTNGNVQINVGSTTNTVFGTTGVTMSLATLAWSSTTASPSLTQVATSVASTNGQTLLIQAQNATGTGSNGGNIELLPGTGTAANGNIALFGTGSFGSGTFVLYIANATSIPSTNPSGGGILYVTGGALKYRGSSGTVTSLASA